MGNKEGISKKRYCRNLTTDEGATSEYLESLNRLGTGLTVAKQNKNHPIPSPFC